VDKKGLESLCESARDASVLMSADSVAKKQTVTLITNLRDAIIMLQDEREGFLEQQRGGERLKKELKAERDQAYDDLAAAEADLNKAQAEIAELGHQLEITRADAERRIEQASPSGAAVGHYYHEYQRKRDALQRERRLSKTAIKSLMDENEKLKKELEQVRELERKTLHEKSHADDVANGWIARCNHLMEALERIRTERDEARSARDGCSKVQTELAQAGTEVLLITKQRDEARAEVKKVTKERDDALADRERMVREINDQCRVAKDRLGATAEARQAFLRELASAEVIVDAHGSVVQLDAVRDAGEFISAWLHSVDAKPEQEGDDERKERA